MTRRFNRLMGSAVVLCAFVGVSASAESGDVFGHAGGDILGSTASDIVPSQGASNREPITSSSWGRITDSSWGHTSRGSKIPNELATQGGRTKGLDPTSFALDPATFGLD